MLLDWFCHWRMRPALRIVPTIGRIREQVGCPGRTHRCCVGPKGRFLMATVQITDSENVQLKVDLTTPSQDKKGNPAAPIDAGSLSWQVDNPNVLAITPSDDGTTCDCAAVGPLGVANVSVKGTAGGQPCAGVIEIDVGSGAPASINISAGTPTEQ